MTNEQAIRDAISRSISRSEIVHVSINASADDLPGLVSATQSADWDSSPEGCDEDGRELIDVYSVDESANQWRIKVTVE